MWSDNRNHLLDDLLRDSAWCCWRASSAWRRGSSSPWWPSSAVARACSMPTRASGSAGGERCWSARDFTACTTASASATNRRPRHAGRPQLRGAAAALGPAVPHRQLRAPLRRHRHPRPVAGRGRARLWRGFWRQQWLGLSGCFRALQARSPRGRPGEARCRMMRRHETLSIRLLACGGLLPASACHRLVAAAAGHRGRPGLRLHVLLLGAAIDACAPLESWISAEPAAAGWTPSACRLSQRDGGHHRAGRCAMPVVILLSLLLVALLMTPAIVEPGGRAALPAAGAASAAARCWRAPGVSWRRRCWRWCSSCCPVPLWLIPPLVLVCRR
jgi:hypothetical protein